MKSVDYLRQFIRESLLLEVAAAEDDLAGFLEDSSDWGIKAITLYSTAKLMQNPDDTDDAVVGYIAAQKPKDPCAGAWEIKMSGGKGYGKILYGAMFGAVGGTLMPDRKTVSDKASAGWAKQGGRKKIPLDYVDAKASEKMTPDDPSDDCEVRSWKIDPATGKGSGDPVLDIAYEPLGNEKSMLAKLMSKHENLMQTLQKKGKDRSEIESNLSRSGPQRFNIELYS